MSIKEIAPEEKVLDYLCQMNNEIVEKTYQQLVNKRLQRGVGEGIEPITLAEINAIKQNTFARQIAFRRIKEESEGVEHSREESIKSFREEVQDLKENHLTSVARDRIAEVRLLHEQENEIDIKMCHLLEEYDSSPSQKEKAETNKKQEVSQNIKKGWKPELR